MPRLRKVGAIGIAVPAISMVVGLSQCLNEAGVPRRMASDLLALRQRPFSRNQLQSAFVHRDRLRVSLGRS